MTDEKARGLVGCICPTRLKGGLEHLHNCPKVRDFDTNFLHCRIGEQRPIIRRRERIDPRWVDPIPAESESLCP